MSTEARQQPLSLERWLLNNRKYLRSIGEMGGDGSYGVSLPIDECRGANICSDDEAVVLPSDLAGQLGINADPVFEIYTLSSVFD